MVAPCLADIHYYVEAKLKEYELGQVIENSRMGLFMLSICSQLTNNNDTTTSTGTY